MSDADDQYNSELTLGPESKPTVEGVTTAEITAINGTGQVGGQSTTKSPAPTKGLKMLSVAHTRLRSQGRGSLVCGLSILDGNVAGSKSLSSGVWAFSELCAHRRTYAHPHDRHDLGRIALAVCIPRSCFRRRRTGYSVRIVGLYSPGIVFFLLRFSFHTWGLGLRSSLVTALLDQKKKKKKKKKKNEEERSLEQELYSPDVSDSHLNLSSETVV
ncbi:hypothetical protein SprV_0200898200 [Sparganum proliferum]